MELEFPAPQVLESNFPLVRNTMLHKLNTSCATIESFNLTPKSFITEFLTYDEMGLASKRRLWASRTGWPSTKKLLISIKNLVCKDVEGREFWEEFILGQASNIVISEVPRRGAYPHGSYVNSQHLKSSFFTDEERVARNKDLTNSMLFLYKLLKNKLRVNEELPDEEGDLVDKDCGLPDQFADKLAPLVPTEEEEEEEVINESDKTTAPKERINLTETNVNEYEGVSLAKSSDPAVRKALRAQTVDLKS
ncbi:hypothetical protein PtA15_6A10 [Puccinia triticina]|uniref:Uncharacterized protein n=1 Tax=Puccinia triticina TaxID=208348 RepID=A0ABY7CN25_9BASI|nr:uncharacterized protein PtA15_6A10 [Puccinia triticina]WAQ85382.1 hypothetical protein PtA15_6A10 [Puccinia triticina]WAR55272.1 hypothetical protein PtB15_6B11 [Puccinia triticina]